MSEDMTYQPVVTLARIRELEALLNAAIMGQQALERENAELRAKLDAVPVGAINTVVHAAVHAYDMRGDRQDVTAILNWLRQQAVQ